MTRGAGLGRAAYKAAYKAGYKAAMARQHVAVSVSLRDNMRELPPSRDLVSSL